MQSINKILGINTEKNSELKNIKKKIRDNFMIIAKAIMLHKCTKQMLDDYEKLNREYHKIAKTTKEDIEHFNDKMKKLRAHIKIG